MAVPRVNVTVTPELGWVVAVPELCAGQTCDASTTSLRALSRLFEPVGCRGCSRLVEQAMEAISEALAGIDDEPSPGDATD
jgi:hypothetical protein